jgi:hypothetical protein
MTITINQSEIAVSEVVGFIIILGIMMTGIGLVTLYGYPALIQEQSNANIKNMQRNMIVLQNDMESLTYKSVPYEETTLQVSDGTLSVINPNPDPMSSSPGHSHFRILQNSNPIDFDPTIPGSIYFYPGLIQFVSSPPNAIIGLQNGAVVMNYFGQQGSTMLSDPRWFLDFDQSGRETLVLSFVQVYSPNVLSSGGTGTVQMKVSELYPTQDITIPNSQVDITYIDNGEGYSTAWHNFFSNTRVFPSSSCSVSGTTLTITGVDRLVIKSYNITVLNL